MQHKCRFLLQFYKRILSSKIQNIRTINLKKEGESTMDAFEDD
jgi:hypothetical protein